MNFASFHFAEPRWLWLAVVAPVLLAWLHRHAAKARREQLARMASPHFVEQLTASHSPARRRLKNFLLLAAVALAGLALARPQWGKTESVRAWLGEDVVFVLDCSRSMTAKDVLPSRLQAAKFAIRNFVARHSSGRVGLVVFSGSAFIQCPLTFDYDAFEETLLAMDENTLPRPGTDIGRALQEAYHAMDKSSRRKMIVLVTDGEDLELAADREKSGVVAAKNLATNGVVIFTVGVGTPAGQNLQFVNAAGQTELVRDEKGDVVQSRLDETTLREIAKATGGDYFPLGRTGEGLARIGPAVQLLDHSAKSGAQKTSGVDRYIFPIAAMLALLVAESLIGTRRKVQAAP
jgi:Ca-activated chloride channel family protein